MKNTLLSIAKAGLVGISLSVSPQLYAAAPSQTDRPNIIYIIADDLGWNDVSFHGSEIKTPNIDKLARQGVILDRFYVCPVCSPTRAGIMTGRYPIRYGMQQGVVSPNERHGICQDDFTLAEMLDKEGYSTRAMIGKWHLGHASTMYHPLRNGFTSFYGHYNGAIDYFTHKRSNQLDWHRNYESCYDEGYSTDLLGNEAVKIIQNSEPGKPFYIHLCFNASHSPLQAKPEDLKACGFDPDKGVGKNTDEGLGFKEGQADYGQQGRGNNARQTYAAITTALDRQVGAVLDAVDQKGISDNTIIIFHSDNGGIPNQGGSNLPLRGHKFDTWEGGVRVVAMIRWPGELEGGKTCDKVMGYIDMWPTLAAAVGYEGNDGNPRDGINMLPVLQGKQQAPDRPFCLGEDAVVTQDWKLVKGELFAISKDPCEKTDVAKQNPQIVEKLKVYRKDFRSMKGPQCETKLAEPATWPPIEWKLPEE